MMDKPFTRFAIPGQVQAKSPQESSLVAPLKHHHASDALARMHEVEGLVDVFERHDVGDHRVDLDFAVHVPVDDGRDVGAAAGSAEG